MAAISVLVALAGAFGLCSAAPLTTDTSTYAYSMFPTDICGSIAPGQRIVGGSAINQAVVPYQAQICVNSGGSYAFNCGGTLITENCVMTAAHCFLYSTNPSDYMINLGKQYSNQSQECNAESYYVDSFVMHPLFSSALLTNDIALVFIKSKYNQPVQFTDYILPACLPFPDPCASATTRAAAPVASSYYTTGTMGQVTGWGKLSETATAASPNLMSASIPMSSTTTCASAYATMGVPVNASSQFCASYPTGGVDACAGDSGGPFVVQSSGKSCVVGIVSYGKGCAEAGYPGVYTNVASFQDWIIQTYITYLQGKGKWANCTTTTTPTSSGTTTYSTVTVSTTTTTTTATTTTTKSTTTATTAAPLVRTLGPICQNQYTTVTCNAGQTLNVLSVFYGRSDQTTCRTNGIAPSYAATLPCNPISNPNAYLAVYNQCQGQTGCAFFGYYSNFYDGCPSVDKYTTVTFSCS